MMERSGRDANDLRGGRRRRGGSATPTCRNCLLSEPLHHPPSSGQHQSLPGHGDHRLALGAWQHRVRHPQNAAHGAVIRPNLRGQTLKSCRRAGDRGRVTVSADIHVHVVLLTVVEKWDGSIGALHAIEDNPRHGITPVVADADVVERLAVAVVDLE